MLRTLLIHIPGFLVVLRFVLGPAVLVLGWNGRSGWLFLFCFLLAFVSDVFDGILARRLGVVTERLRQTDGWVDAWFYVCLLLGMWWGYQEVLAKLLGWIGLIVALQIVTAGLDWFKYGRLTSYHAILAKAWSLSLFTALVIFFATGKATLLPLALFLGLLSSLENLAITLLLPYWAHDIPSVFHAWQQKKKEKDHA